MARVPRRLTAIAIAATLAGALLGAQATAPEIPFDADAGLLKTPPDVFVGEVAGVGTNSRGQIFVYTRTGHPYATLGDNRTFLRGGSRLFQFDAGGRFVRELGQDVYGFNVAIGLRVDAQDNVWTIDAAANQIVKFDPQGQIALVLGRKPEAIAVRTAPPAAGRGNAPTGAGTPGSSFNRPADVAWDKAGNIYVADGLGTNNRVAKFDKDGRFIAHWGSTGTGPGQFKGVKAIAVDAAGNVYVADAGNKRIQVFDAAGAYTREFAGVGTPLAMCMTTGAPQVLYVSHAGDEDGMEDAAIYKVRLDGTVIGRFGTAGKRPKQFGLANSIDCRREHDLLVGEMTNWRVQRITLRTAAPGR
jgi:DNA-binding beta-propeller fold protein YncE